MLNEKIISICIPTYNGAQTIVKTLASLTEQIEQLPNYQMEIEIILTDDQSSDNTKLVIKEFSLGRSYIKFFENDNNLGMDGNFRQAALNATGKFVWFSGQDDVFLAGAVKHILEAIKSNPDLGIIYVNYSQYSEELRKNTCDSMFHRQVYAPDKINFNQDLLFQNSTEYFGVFFDAPTFLPATVMRREYWLKTDTNQFIGTHYIQYANILINLRNCQLLAVTKPYIRGVIPADGWYKNGRFLFSVILGNMKAQTIVFRNYPGALPNKVYYKKKGRFAKQFFPLVLAAKLGGHRLTKANQENLQYIFGSGFYYFYFLPLLFLGQFFPNKLIKLLKNIKHNIFKSSYE